MKKIIEKAIPEKAKYFCDICGKEIEQDSYETNVIKITENSIGSNGWNIYPVVKT